MRLVEKVWPVDLAWVVTSNRRVHWSRRYQVQHYHRGMAYVMFRRPPFTFDRARITVTFAFPTRRKRDVANLYDLVVKPIVDGVVDAGLLPDDNDTHLIGPDIRRAPGPSATGKVSITVRVEEA